MVTYVRRLVERFRGRAVSSEYAEDVVQAFLTDCVEKEWLGRADNTRGSFRVFVRVLLKRYTMHHLKAVLAKKRQPGGGRKLVSLEALDVSLAGSADPSEDAHAFDRSWVQIAIDSALRRLRDENLRYHEVILDLILTHGEGSHDLPKRLGLVPDQMAVLRHRARSRFSSLFEEDFRTTVRDRAELESEWEALHPFLP
jgi:hypothetical protein